jgi:hypothetical protein
MLSSSMSMNSSSDTLNINHYRGWSRVNAFEHLYLDESKPLNGVALSATNL